MSLPPALRNRNNAATGAAAEAAFVREVAKRFVDARIWRNGANHSARYNKDVFGFDIIWSTRSGFNFAQVKATEKPPKLASDWLAQYCAWVRPSTTHCYVAWLRPDSAWQVWLLTADGRMEDAGW